MDGCTSTSDLKCSRSGCHAYVMLDLRRVIRAAYTLPMLPGRLFAFVGIEWGSRARGVPGSAANLASDRLVPASWVARPFVRVLQRSQWLHVPGPGKWARVPDGPGIRIGSPGPGECRHEGLHGVSELFCQWRHARA